MLLINSLQDLGMDFNNQPIVIPNLPWPSFWHPSGIVRASFGYPIGNPKVRFLGKKEIMLAG